MNKVMLLALYLSWFRNESTHMLNIVAIIFVFSVLVIIHELGHFLAARWMGVRVDKFSIGFPPTIYSRKIGQTEFSISAIPLGGFVKMAGFIDESMDTEATGAEDEFSSKPVWKRIVIITAGVVMNLLLAVLIMTMLNFFQGERIIPNTTVGQVEAGIAQKVGFQENDEILAINGQSVNNWNQIQEIFIDNLNRDITFTVLRNGQEVTLAYNKEWFKSEGGERLNLVPKFPAKVGDVNTGMPAGELGLQRGDVITSLAGKEISDWKQMTEIIRQYPGEEISVTWLRDGKQMEGTIAPQVFEEKNEDDETIEVGKIGIGYYYEHRDVGPFTAIKNGVINTIDLIGLNIRGLWWVISGTKSAQEILGGPIMIAKMAGDAAQAGWTYLWYLIAALSAILAFFNILPIPALDGGHLFFLVIEGVMGKPLPVSTRLRIQQIGMAILLTLIIFIIYIDLRRLLF
ncbi:MAG: RIP metalloprotease RseP [Caldithrix sp.]|nr:RIP metalloprotease RseP [Caldithrix sp.]